jgi:TolA-binding protein
MKAIDPNALPPRLLEGGAEDSNDLATAEFLAQGPQTLPPPDDLTLERVWRDVGRNRRSANKRRRRFWPLSLGTGLAAAACLFLLFLRTRQVGRPPAARIELTAGSVLMAEPNRSWTQAQAGNPIPDASQLRTQRQSRALLTLARSTVLASPDTDVEVESTGPETVLRLSHGTVVANVDPRRAGESFVVQTTRFRATVKGTLFEVSERSPGDVSVNVSRGLVAVAGSDGTWEVPAGRSWHSLTPTAIRADEITTSDRGLLDEASVAGDTRAPIRVEGPEGVEIFEGGVDLGPAPVTWDAPLGRYHFVGTAGAARTEGDVTTASPDVATVLSLSQVATGPEPTRVPSTEGTSPAPRPSESAPKEQPASEERHGVRGTPEEPKAHKSPVAMLAPTRADAWIPVPPSSPTPQKRPQVIVSTEPPPPSTKSPPAATAAAVPAPTTVPDAYLDALALCSNGRYQEAAISLSAIAKAHGPHAELALYHLAQIEQKQLGNPAEALQTYLRYEEEYPNGVLLQEAELSLIELQIQRSAFDGAMAHMDRFLAEHPDGERAPDVHLLRGNVLRQRGDCRAALVEYDRARGNSRVEDDAVYFSGRCEQLLGQPDAAAILFRDYLRRFPAGQHVAQAQAALETR